MGRVRGSIAGSLLVLGLGCAPLSVQQGARTVGAGNTTVGMSVGALQNSDQEQEGEEEFSSFQLGLPNAWARHGFNDRMDGSLQFFPGGIRADGKVALAQSERFAVAAGVGLFGGYARNADDQSSSTNSGYGADVSLYASVALGASADLNVGGRGAYALQSSRDREEFGGVTDTFETDTTNTAFGGFFGATFRRDKVAITPEIAVYRIEGETESEGFDSKFQSLAIVPSVGFSVGF